MNKDNNNSPWGSDGNNPWGGGPSSRDLENSINEYQKLLKLTNLIEKKTNGTMKKIPINLPKNLCINSHQNITLNSFNDIE